MYWFVMWMRVRSAIILIRSFSSEQHVRPVLCPHVRHRWCHLVSMVTRSSCAAFTDANREKQSTYAKAIDMAEGTIELQNWMPKDAVSRATTICEDFAVITDGSTVTAWDTRAPEAT